MGYWDNKAATPANIRQYRRGEGWLASEDRKNDKDETLDRGSARSIEEVLTLALNASNLVLLTGAGSSFCARNEVSNAKQAPGMRDLWDSVANAATQPVINAIAAKIPNAKAIADAKNIEKFLTHCKLYLELFGIENAKDISAFTILAEKTIAASVDFVTEKTDLTAHQAIVRKIARRGVRKTRVRMFTTNYDLCFEYAAQSLRFTVIDGFSHSIPQIYDRGHFAHDIVRRDGGKDSPDYIENVFHLYKLHGSVDWRRKGSELLRSRSDEDGTATLIYPRDSKYQEAFESPYLDMMSAFQTALREPDTALIVSGFGFNDDHISKPIMAAIEANMTLRVVVCDPAFLADAELEKGEHTLSQDSSTQEYASLFHAKLKKLVDIGDQRISLLNGRFEDLAHAIPDLVAQTERERHAERVKVLYELPASVFP
ncbi:SIR2 family protein [Phyllobacterium sp. CCNWLW109]|uniref:SIR2 family protein n=1 Tax=Phyllobacterium sp. CCNWLW109 TaxID=3127479 RepID=UPI003077A74D